VSIKRQKNGFREKLFATSVLAAMMGATPFVAAHAQDVEADDEQAVQETVIVTGTRITNPNLAQASQIQVIGVEEINLRQVNSVEELVRDLPGIVPSIGPGVNNGQNGAQQVNLRGIGANRNLVLLNGRRIVPFGLAATTDTNNIPAGLIERVDIVTGGASTVYGADAVSGVVNFVTKQDFEGVEFQGSYRTTEEGDGEVWRGEVLLGANFDDGRGNAVFSVGYQDADPILQGDRSFSEFVIDSGDGSQGGSINSAPLVITTGDAINGTVVTNDQLNPATGLFEDMVVPFNFAPLNLLQTPVERFNLYGAATYEISPLIEVFGESFFTNSTVEQNLAPSAAFNTNVDIPLSNPFLADATRDQLCELNGISAADCLAADGVTDPNAAGFQSINANIRRRFVEVGPRRQVFESDVFNFSGGLRGELYGWGWELSGQYGESTQVTTTSGFGLAANLQQALFAVDETTCVDPSGGCTPINIFGDIGTLTPESFAFLDATAATTVNSSLGGAQLTVTGDLGETFKSPFANEQIGIATGLEYRRFSANSSGDFLSQQQGALLGAGGADPSISGSFDVFEGYLEVIAPVLSDLPYVKDLTLEGGVRVADYSTSGTNASWKIGGSYEPIEGYKFRSVFQRAVRSANIGELFSPVQGGLGNLATDPCAGAIDPASQLAAICIQQGAPAALIGQIGQPAASQVSITFGGNPDLQVEEADTFTAGFVITPPQVPNLIFTLDYFNIHVADAISNPAEQDIIDDCFGAGNPGLTFNAACAGITRNTLDGSLNVDASVIGGIPLPLSNVGDINTDGIDLSVSYAHDLDTYGDLAYTFNTTYTFGNSFQATPTAVDRDCAGFFSTNCGNLQAEVQFTQRLSYNYKNYTVSARHRFISSTNIEPLAEFGTDGTPNFLPEFTSIGNENYVDLSLQGRFFDTTVLSLTIDNLFDNDPPEVGSDVGTTAFNTGNTFPTVFDARGRTYTFGVNVRF